MKWWPVSGWSRPVLLKRVCGMEWVDNLISLNGFLKTHKSSIRASISAIYDIGIFLMDTNEHFLTLQWAGSGRKGLNNLLKSSGLGWVLKTKVRTPVLRPRLEGEIRGEGNADTEQAVVSCFCFRSYLMRPVIKLPCQRRFNRIKLL